MKDKKKIYILLISLFLIIGFVFFLWIRNSKKSVKISTINQINKEIDEFMKSDQIKSAKVSNIDISTDFSGDFDTLSLDELKKAYLGAVQKSQDNAQILLLQKMYEKNNNKDILYLIVDKSLKIYDFDNALKYTKILYSKDKGLSKLGSDRFFYIMFNSNNLTNEELNDITGLIQNFYDKGKITKADYDFYNSLVYLSRLDINNFKNILSGITDPKYQQIKSSILSTFDEVASYKDVSPYYIDGLLSLVFFQNGYFSIAQKLSLEAVKFNSEYILPNQILAYTNFITNKHDKAKEYFKKLLEVDLDHQFTYKFYLGISQFWAKNYEDSIVFLSQIKYGDLYKDTLRYLVLAYYNINDFDNATKSLSELFKLQPLSESDYYSFFDMFFYKPWEKGENVGLYSQYADLVNQYLKGCIQDLSKDSKYICIYGRGGYEAIRGDDQNALKYLVYISKYHYRDYVFAKIAEIYEKTGDLEKAKQYYVKSVIYSQDDTFKSEYKNKLLDIVMKLKK